MKKNISKIVIILLVTFMAIPVFAKELVSLENIVGSTDDKEVVLNVTDKIDLKFNDLNQKATYKVKLKNNTNDILYVNDLITEDLSEEFIEFSLTEKSYNAKLEPGKTKFVEVTAKTLDITHAGRNVNDEITLKFLLGNKIKNPATSSNWIVYLILCVTLFITFSTMFGKIENKKKLSIFVIGMLLCGTMVVSANDSDYVELKGKVKYTSQNSMQESGTKLNGYKASYVNSTDVWKYAEQVKNIIISDNKTKPEEYEHRYDLTTNNSERIYGYIVKNGDGNVPYDLYIVANGVIYAPVDATGLFSFPNVETIKGLEYIEFDNTTKMTGMFLENKKLKSANIKSINTSNVTNTSYMFNGCDKLSVSEKDFDLSKVINKNYMFNQELIDVVKLNAKSDKNTNFEAAPVTGKYMIESTKNDKNPVYYYRGATKDNNVLFANKCWKMVRTTETGGIKLIYNGVPSNGLCNNTGTASQIGENKFNSSYSSPAYVGYMYGTIYKASSKNLTEQSDVYLYGNDISWDGTKYTLKDTMSSSSWKNDYKTLATKYHYTCFNDTGICENVYYIIYFGKDTASYYLTLKDGKNIEKAKEEMFTNTTDSKIKVTIDNWYASNMIPYTDYLEDTVWCNDRTLTGGPLYSKDTGNTGSSLFAAYGRNISTFIPSVTCSNTRDSFTVDSKNGNGKLTYPVGLLTADEYTMAGSGNEGYSKSAYLHSGQTQWSMSPYTFYHDRARKFYLYSSGYVNVTYANNTHGVRPSVSLKSGTMMVSGDGSVSNPYIVE